MFGYSSLAMRWSVRMLLLSSLTAARATHVAPDAREIVRRAVTADERNWESARSYEFSERVDARRMDSQGRLKSRDITMYDVMLLEGSPYRRLAGRDDRPLALVDETKEQAKLTRSIAERRNETATQRTLRQAAYESRPDWQREAWRELPEAFDFRLTNQDSTGSIGSYAIEATPRPGYQPRSRTAKAFPHVRATLWVDKQDYRLVKAEVEVIDTIWVGLFMVRLGRGSRAAFEQARVTDHVWLPQRVHVVLSARVGLLKVLRIEQEVIYSNCHKSETSFFVAPHRRTETAMVERPFGYPRTTELSSDLIGRKALESLARAECYARGLSILCLPGFSSIIAIEQDFRRGFRYG